MNLLWLENLTKPFASLLNPVAERIGNWLGRRRPRLYVHFEPTQSLWCLSHNGDQELMQVMFSAGFNHDDPKQTLVIMDAYPSGTHVEIPGNDKFSVPPGQVVRERVYVFVSPVPAKGKPWTGRFILVDQFHRRHKTQKVVLRWVG